MAYINAHYQYYNTFKDQLLLLYNSVKVGRYDVFEDCDGTTVSKTVRPAYYTPSTIRKWFSEEYFLEIYFKIRFFEEESQFTDNEKDLIIDDSIEIYRNSGVARSLFLFEKVLNKTFDYSGSLGYIIEQQLVIADEEFREAEEFPSEGY